MKLVLVALLLLCEVSYAWLPRRGSTVGVLTAVDACRRRGLCQQQRSRESAAGSKLFALPGGFTLDRSAIPRGILWSRDSNNFPLLVLTVLLLVRALPRKVKVPVPTVTLADVERFLWPEWLQNAIEKVKIPFLQTFMFVRLCIKVVLAKTMLLVGSIIRTITKTFNPAEEVDLKDWNVCILSERESLSGGIIKYRFELPYASNTIPLYVGQELTMCLVDARDRVLKEAFFPVSSNNARGYFDILIRRGGVESSPFVRSLETMALGDEMAFKGGRYRLNYLGQDDPISAMTIVTSGLGVAPTLQMLRGILTDRDSTVEDVDLLWINESKGDFVCEEDVEALELRHIEKVVVTRVIEDDIYGRDLLKNERIEDAVSPYEEGRVAVICAPDYITSTLRTLFQDLGYPPESILSVTIN